MAKAVLGIIGAVVGAGFASGREIMQFFSRRGNFSWALAALAVCAMAGLMDRIMKKGNDLNRLLPPENSPWLFRLPLFLLFLTAGGAMTAAAGELAALTVPLHHARAGGSLAALAACTALSRKPGNALGCLGGMLLPALIAEIILCLNVPGGVERQARFSFPAGLDAAFQAVSYSGMNAALAAGVLCDTGAGRSRRDIRRITAGAACVLALLLGAENAVLLPHADELERAALPTVMLLRHYGKAGYYLSAAVLFLAVSTTLIAALHGLRSLLPQRRAGEAAFLLTAFSAQLGFGRIVGTAYPILGILSMMLLLWPKKPDFGKKKR